MTYSRGNLNYLIDSLVHPLYKESQGYRILDGVLHAIVEQNPTLSLEKFVKYNTLDLLKGKRKTSRKSRRGLT
jgi:hypothetical protein